MPELPTIAEVAVPGFEAVSSYSLYVPTGVPPAIIRRVNAALIQAMQSADTQKAVLAEGADMVPVLSPPELRVKLERDFVEMEKVIREAKIQL